MALQLVQVPPLKLSVPTPALVSVNGVSVVPIDQISIMIVRTADCSSGRAVSRARVDRVRCRDSGACHSGSNYSASLNWHQKDARRAAVPVARRRVDANLSICRIYVDRHRSRWYASCRDRWIWSRRGRGNHYGRVLHFVPVMVAPTGAQGDRHAGTQHERNSQPRPAETFRHRIRSLEQNVKNERKIAVVDKQSKNE